MKTGTNHFENLAAAIRYYSYGFTPAQVQEKLDAGEIAIGKPETKPGETVFLIKGENRYGIDDGRA